jgi:hypothetical protein
MKQEDTWVKDEQRNVWRLLPYGWDFDPYWFGEAIMELVACPFCGSQPEVEISSTRAASGLNRRFIRCGNKECDVRPRTKTRVDKVKVKDGDATVSLNPKLEDAWNKRA